MAYRSLGGAKPLEFIPRERDHVMIGCNVDPEFHDKLKSYCDENRIKVSQLIRFSLARAMETM